jgi:hypothetical protein
LESQNHVGARPDKNDRVFSKVIGEGYCMIDSLAVVSGGSPDYLIDVVADGMVRFLGREKVCVEYSWLSNPRRDDKRFRYFYDVTAAQPNSISLGQCQALVASTQVPMERIIEYKEKVGGTVAVVDGEDTAEMKPEYLDVSDVYFKREYFKNGRYPSSLLNLPYARARAIVRVHRRYPEKVFNLPFGIIPFDYGFKNTNQQKIGNLFFAGKDTSKVRRQLKKAIIEQGSHGYTYMANVLNMSDYAAEIRRHWICASLRGSGWDTYRYWEIPYVGSVLLCQESPLKIDNDFVHGESCLRFSTVDQAMALAADYLKKKDRLVDIATKGNELVLKEHMSINRAIKVWKTINSFTK